MKIEQIEMEGEDSSGIEELTSNRQLPQGHYLAARSLRSRSKSDWLASWLSALLEAGVRGGHPSRVEAFL